MSTLIWNIEYWDSTEWVLLYTFQGTFRQALDHVHAQPNPHIFRVRRLTNPI